MVTLVIEVMRRVRWGVCLEGRNQPRVLNGTDGCEKGVKKKK